MVYAGFKGAPFVPMRHHDVARVVALAKIKMGEKVYELGCGDARVSCALASCGSTVVGLEISLLPYLLAKLRILFLKKKSKIAIQFANFWKINLQDADLVYFWLMPEFFEKLKTKLQNELKAGTKIISYVWPLPGWEPAEISEEQGHPKIYLYIK